MFGPLALALLFGTPGVLVALALARWISERREKRDLPPLHKREYHYHPEHFD